MNKLYRFMTVLPLTLWAATTAAHPGHEHTVQSGVHLAGSPLAALLLCATVIGVVGFGLRVGPRVGPRVSAQGNADHTVGLVARGGNHWERCLCGASHSRTSYNQHNTKDQNVTWTHNPPPLHAVHG